VNIARIDDVDPRWFESFFEGDDWLLLAAAHDPERTRLEVEFPRVATPGASTCAGRSVTGRHAVALAEHGFHVARRE
jgi:hypothetical protein